MTDVGRMLEEARLNKGITLDKVEADLKIRKAYILAMESGQWEELPGYAYAIGFLRTYAEYLGLPGDEIVEEYKTWRNLQGNRTLAEEPPVGVFQRAKELQTDTGIFRLSARDKGGRHRRRKASRGLAIFLIILVALIAYLLLNWHESFFGTGGEGLPAREVGDRIVEVERPPEGAAEFGVPTQDADLPSDGVPTKAPVLDESEAEADSLQLEAEQLHDRQDNGHSSAIRGAEELAENRAPSETPADREPDLASAPVSSGDEPQGVQVHVTLPEDGVHRLPPVQAEEMIWPITLEAVAEGRCWVEVRCDGEVKLSRTIEAGESFRWQAMEEIRIRFGNADVVKLKLNGQDIGPAGRGVVTRVFTAEQETG
ncbi:MAG: helix-turn-helix domain-containing protein [Firmicutes bacterium]|nr:helix-turn-helix domain-containing protein [Bacillota bacterium]